jgi:hypothetical protein
MGLIGGLWLAVLGVLGAANLIIAKKPDAKELIGKIAPYQGWMGAVSAVWGLWMIIWCIMGLGWMTLWPIYWFTVLIGAVVELALGLLLGVGTLKTFIKAPAATEKLDQTVAKLAPYQGTIGLIGIGVGIWQVLAGFMFYG